MLGARRALSSTTARRWARWAANVQFTAGIVNRGSYIKFLFFHMFPPVLLSFNNTIAFDINQYLVRTNFCAIEPFSLNS